jgi:hypothetical protein
MVEQKGSEISQPIALLETNNGISSARGRMLMKALDL